MRLYIPLKSISLLNNLSKGTLRVPPSGKGSHCPGLIEPDNKRASGGIDDRDAGGACVPPDFSSS